MYSTFEPSLYMATEAVSYDALKDNFTYLRQRKFYLPKGDKLGHGGALFMLTPDKKATMDTINGSYATYFRSGYKIYSTPTYFAERIGASTIKSNKRTQFKKDFIESREDKSMKYINSDELVKIIEKQGDRNFIYDLGEWNHLYFSNRYTRTPAYMCKGYIDFISKKFPSQADIDKYKYRMIYIPADKWFSVNDTLGITKAYLNNPIAIFMWCLYRSPETLSPLLPICNTIIIADEAHDSFIKIPIDNKLINPKEAKKLYQKLKAQLNKMECFKVIDNEEDSEIIQVAEVDKEDLKDELTRRLTGKPKKSTKEKEIDIFNMDEVLGDSTSVSELNEDNESEEETADDVVENIIEEVAEEAEPEDDIDALTTKAETKVRNVLINSYMPNYTAEKTAKLEEYARRQSQVIEEVAPQSINMVKSKIIDKSDFSNVATTHNPNIKESKFVNFEKSYIEKKLKPDMVNSVAKLSKADYPMFINKIDIVDSSDAFNQKETWTYHLTDENGRVQKIVLDVPKIIDNNYIYIGGNKKMILKQRLNRPIVKIDPDRVQINTWYNKCMITRHGQAVSGRSVALKKYIIKNEQKYKVSFGNAKIMNKEYRTSLAFDILAKNIIECQIGDTRFIFDLPKLKDEMEKAGIKEEIMKDDRLACGITKDKKLVRCNVNGTGSGDDEEIEDVIINKFTSSEKTALSNVKEGKTFAYARMTIMAKRIPVIFFMLFCAGWTETMKQCGIEYEVFDNTREIRNQGFDDKHGVIETSDKLIVYPKYPYENSLLLNGLRGLPLSDYSYAELDSKDTYIDMLPLFFTNANMSYNLDQFKNFLLDDASIEMLKDFGQPYELIPLLFYAVKLLVNNQYTPDIDASNMRIRSTEIIPQIAYQSVVNAYGKYRKVASRGNNKNAKIHCPQNEVIRVLLGSSLVDEYSVANPVKTLEKTHECTIKGATSDKGFTLSGMNVSDSMTMAKRAYDQSMMGVFGITSSPDGEVGVKRTLSVEPNITSTRGYIGSVPKEGIDDLNSANLFTFAESLTPPGVRHDDPQRSSMMKSQTSQMVMVDDATPVLIGNKVESVVPYHMSGEFCFVAKQNGVVEDAKDGIYIVRYADGTHDSFDTNPVIHKNSSEGMYTEVKFESKVKVGDKFVKNEVLAADPRSFTMDKDGKGASMNIGVLAKVAIASLYDIYEDSQPISRKLSNKLAYNVINMKSVSLDQITYVDKMVNVGDDVNIGDPLIVFDSFGGDEETKNLFASIKDESVKQDLYDTTQTTVKSDESGHIEDIRVYTTVPVEELSPTLQTIVKKYHKKIEAKGKFLDKYKNEGDNNFYKCGHVITETTDVVDTNFGVIKGARVDNGVYIEFYIKHKDAVKKGDKNTNYCALKGVTSHIMPDGQEPWSEFRPDEEISAFVAPLGILARKTPSIFLSLFGNKVLIETKRRLMDDWNKD